MQSNEKVLRLHSENYVVPKGQEQVVHYKIAKVNTSGGFIEKPRLVKTKLKLFETVVRRNLETMGYLVEILFHPLGKLTNVRIVDKDTALADKDAEIARLKEALNNTPTEATADKEKDDEIARLKAEIEALKAKKSANTGKASKGGAKGEKTETKKGE